MRIICSHGFGVRADGKGLFTDLASDFPEFDFVTFDYNLLHDDGNMQVRPLGEQARLLQSRLDEPYEGKTIILAHSQGCMTAGMADLHHADAAILLAPPQAFSIRNFMQRLAGRPDTTLDPAGMSSVGRADGSKLLIPADYIAGMQASDPMRLYTAIAATIPTTIVRAGDDTTVGATDFSSIPGAQQLDIMADHNFTGAARAGLAELLAPVLGQYS